MSHEQSRQPSQLAASPVVLLPMEGNQWTGEGAESPGAGNGSGVDLGDVVPDQYKQDPRVIALWPKLQGSGSFSRFRGVLDRSPLLPDQSPQDWFNAIIAQPPAPPKPTSISPTLPALTSASGPSTKVASSSTSITPTKVHGRPGFTLQLSKPTLHTHYLPPNSIDVDIDADTAESYKPLVKPPSSFSTVKSCNASSNRGGSANSSVASSGRATPDVDMDFPKNAKAAKKPRQSDEEEFAARRTGSKHSRLTLTDQRMRDPRAVPAGNQTRKTFNFDLLKPSAASVVDDANVYKKKILPLISSDVLNSSMVTESTPLFKLTTLLKPRQKTVIFDDGEPFDQFSDAEVELTSAEYKEMIDTIAKRAPSRYLNAFGQNRDALMMIAYYMQKAGQVGPDESDEVVLGWIQAMTSTVKLLIKVDVNRDLDNTFSFWRRLNRKMKATYQRSGNANAKVTKEFKAELDKFKKEVRSTWKTVDAPAPSFVASETGSSSKRSAEESSNDTAAKRIKSHEVTAPGVTRTRLPLKKKLAPGDALSQMFGAMPAKTAASTPTASRTEKSASPDIVTPVERPSNRTKNGRPRNKVRWKEDFELVQMRMIEARDESNALSFNTIEVEQEGNVFKHSQHHHQSWYEPYPLLLEDMEYPVLTDESEAQTEREARVPIYDCETENAPSPSEEGCSVVEITDEDTLPEWHGRPENADHGNMVSDVSMAFDAPATAPVASGVPAAQDLNSILASLSSSGFTLPPPPPPLQPQPQPTPTVPSFDLQNLAHLSGLLGNAAAGPSAAPVPGYAPPPASISTYGPTDYGTNSLNHGYYSPNHGSGPPDMDYNQPRQHGNYPPPQEYAYGYDESSRDYNNGGYPSRGRNGGETRPRQGNNVGRGGGVDHRAFRRNCKFYESRRPCPNGKRCTFLHPDGIYY